MKQLNGCLQHSIVRLSAQGSSARKVAHEPGLSRDTVGRCLRLAADAAKPAIPPIGSKSRRTRPCTPLREIIQKGLAAGLSAQRIHQDLVIEHRFTGHPRGCH